MRRTVRPEASLTPQTVSVVVPCYNYGRFLPEAVNSVLTQQNVRADVIVVDDASTDDSLHVARALAAADGRVRVIAQECNRGHIATYNEGIRHVNGRYAVLLSADDLLAPGALWRATALLESDPGISFVYGHAPMFEGQPPAARVEPRSWSIWSGAHWIRRLCRRGNGLIVCPEVVMRTDVLRRTGGYDPRMPHAADMHMWMQAAVLGRVGRVNGVDQAFYRVHGRNMHLNDYAGELTDARARAEVFEIFFAETLPDHRDRRHLHDQARRAIALEAVQLACRAYDLGERDQKGEFVAFAQETWPQVVTTRSWAAYLRRRDARATAAERALASVQWRLSGSVRWRRWRRTGL